MTALNLSRTQALVLALGALVLFVVVGHRLAGAGASRPPAPTARLTAVAAPASASRVVVDVVGAVRAPGLYRLRQGSRIADAVARAGGATRTADLAAVNLAAPLADGVQVVVPVRAAAGSAAGTGAPGASGAPAAKVSLASATIDQLDALPGVGPVTAQKIVDFRQKHGPFRSVDDLDAIPGIGPARIEQLRDLVTP